VKSTIALPATSGVSDGASTGLTSSHHADAPYLVLLPFEAKARGFKNTLAFRRWCRRHGVGVHNDGRLQWVDRREVDAVIVELASAARPANSLDAAPSQDAASLVLDPVASAVETLIFTGRKR